MNHADSLRPWSRYRPHKAALIDGGSGRAWTYQDLHLRADRAAAWLREVHGVGPGDRVAVLAWNRVEQVDLYFACARLGAILVPLNWRLAAPEVLAVVADCQPRVCLFGDEVRALAETLSGALPLQPIDPEAPWSAVPQATLPPADCAADTPIMLLYTSGSTGRPKGAILTHGTVTWNAVNTVSGWELQAGDVSLVHTPLFHTGGWGVFLLPLLHAGGTCVLTPRFDPAQCLDLIARHQITLVFAVPTMWQMLTDLPGWAEADLRSIRFAINGGAACPLPLLLRWAERGIRFKQGFGLTEVGPNCFVMPDGSEVDSVGSVGFPMPHLEALRVRDDGTEALAQEPGELLLRGPTVCAGYWNDPAATAASRRDGGWFATGDLMVLDPNGHFRFVGRKKEIFVSGGENVHPAEVERVIHQVPGVAEAAVVPVPDALWGEVGHAFVSFRDDAPPGLGVAEILAHMKEHLARYKVPKHLTVLSALPKGATGKIDKRSLKALHPGAPSDVA